MYGGASDSGAGPEHFVVDTTALDDLALLFERDAEWTRDLGAAKPELQKKWGSLRDELSGLHMTVLTDSMGLVTFWDEVIKKTKSLVEALQKMVTEDYESWKGIEKEFVKLRS